MKKLLLISHVTQKRDNLRTLKIEGNEIAPVVADMKMGKTRHYTL